MLASLFGRKFDEHLAVGKAEKSRSGVEEDIKLKPHIQLYHAPC